MICVTGATGFVGRHLVRRLVADGCTVRCLVRPGGPSAERLRDLPVEVATASLGDADSMRRALCGARQIIHLAAPITDARDAVVDGFHRTGTRCLIEGARAARVERIVMLSPLGTASSAGLPYLRARGAAEEQVRGSGLPFVILQSPVMFGREDRLLGGMMRLLRRTGVMLIPGTGQTMLQPIWVGDVASCVLRCLRDEEVLDRTIPIGGPQHLTYEEIADQVAQMLNLPRARIHLSLRTVRWLARLLEGTGGSPFVGYRHLELLEVGTITAPDAVRRSFGFQPMPLTEGIAYQMQASPVPSGPGPRPGSPHGARSRRARR
jgi:NADH dehydrogenase